MRKDTLYTGEEVRMKLAGGIAKVAEAVGGTMGTGGGNSIIESMHNPGHLVTNDGYSIANSVRLADPIENIGKNILLEAINRANKASGDGSSTTCVLTAAIIEEGQSNAGHRSPMEIKRSLEACIPVIEASIKAQTRDITVEEVGQVAAISAEDPEIGAKIQEIYEKIGKDGIIHWDISKTAEDSYTIGSGLTIEGAKLASPYMGDKNKETGELLALAKLKNAQVIITKEKLTTAAVFEGIFTQLNQKGKKEVVVFCDDFEIQVIAQLIATEQVQGFRTLVVKMPVIYNDTWTADLAAASGATVIDPAAGLSIKDMKLEHLGTFGHVIADKDNVYVDGIKDLTAYIQGNLTEDDDATKDRIKRLNTKTARYFVGAQSDSALSYRRLKVEDAISAAYQALNGGIVIGGGIALIKAGREVDHPFLLNALRAPYLQIEKNLGHSFSEEDMEEQKVYDPANIVLNAVKNAISVAATVLTASTVVVLPREEQEQMMVPPNQI